MGARNGPLTPAVFDTGVVVSALLFPHGTAAALRGAWRNPALEALVSSATLDEQLRALTYSKFALDEAAIKLLLADCLPFTRLVEMPRRKPAGLPRCRVRDDQKFLELAAAGRARCLVTGDRDLLARATEVRFEILTVTAFLELRPLSPS